VLAFSASLILISAVRAERSRLENLKSEKRKIDEEFESGLRKEVEDLAEAISRCSSETAASTKVTE